MDSKQEIRAWALLILSLKKKDKSFYQLIAEKKELERIIKYIENNEIVSDTTM
jgi:uncharacterized protein YdcH (DUF465 family)